MSLVTRYACCSEGGDITHQLFLDDKPLKDFVQPCHSISAAEQVGGLLWLGTRTDGTYGAFPAEGIVVQTMDGERKIGQISTKDGLTGDLVRAIRISPFDSLVWVATNQGLNAITSHLKIMKSVYFYQDFDPVTGIPTYLISPTPRENPMMVELARQLRLSDYRAFRDIWQSIPKPAAEKIVNGMIDSAYNPENTRNGHEAFAPLETNSLAPFFIEASRSRDYPTRYLAYRSLGSLNDPRAIARFVELRSDCRNCLPPDREMVAEYLDKYAMLGLIPQKSTAGLTRKLKEDLDSALNALSEKRQNPSRHQSIKTAISSALSLIRMSDLYGINRINEYFRASSGNDDDASFYDSMVQRMFYENDLRPAILEGLQKFHSLSISHGCAYFDMRWKYMPRRYDPAAAKAILIGISHLFSPGSHLRYTAAPLQFWTSLLETCTGAFQSQMGDPATRTVFMGKYYGSLSPSEKALMEKMSRGQKPELTW